MAIKGSLKEASLPDVIQLLSMGRKTGCLAVAHRQNFGYIYFEDGRITFASIVNRRDRIGDMLVRSGRISHDQLNQAVDRQAKNSDHKLGEILVDMGLVTRAELEVHMRVQVEEAVYFLFTWNAGTFNFEAGVRPEREDFLISIGPESLLLEGARRVDEWSLIAKKIPSLDLVFQADAARVAASGVRLSEEQEQLLPLLDGTRDVQELVDATGLVEFEVGKALYGLIAAGFAHRVGTSASEASQPRVNDARVEEHRNLGIAFYKTGMLDEATREFRRVAELRPAEANAPFHLGLIALRQARWQEAADAFRLAVEKGGIRPAALHNLAYALERLGLLAEAEAAAGEAVARAREDARLMIGWGIIALKRDDFEVAQGRLMRARELLGSKPAPALWFWAAALAAAGRGELPAGIAVAREGIERWPAQSVLRNNLAVLLEAAGEVAEAEQVLRAALADDASLPQLSKNLGDLLYRAGRFDDAQEAYDRAVKLAPELGDDLYFKLGNLAFKRRDRDRARECWQRAATLNPAHQLARANLEILDVPRVIAGDEASFLALTRKVSQDAGLALDAYKDKCLRRRIAVRMRACGVHTYAEYVTWLESHPEEYEKLKDALTINVTRFYRNPETWDRLRTDVVPRLLAARQGRLSAWSAGCASGEEAYTLAMLCVEAAEAAGHPSWAERVRIDATDIDRDCLARAAEARYPAQAFSEAPPELAERYCDRSADHWVVSERVRRLVRVRRVDLLLEPPPGSGYDLVLCRNVVIYFDRPTQERLFALFAGALAGGGFLVLGKVETLLGPGRDRLTLYDARERIFRRPE